MLLEAEACSKSHTVYLERGVPVDLWSGEPCLRYNLVDRVILDAGSHHDLHVCQDLPRGKAAGEADCRAGEYITQAVVSEHTASVYGRSRAVPLRVLRRLIAVFGRERSCPGVSRQTPRSQHHAVGSSGVGHVRWRRIAPASSDEARA